MTQFEYETIQSRLSLLPKKQNPYRNRSERDSYKQAILACKSAIHSLHRYGPSPGGFTTLPAGREELYQVIKVLDRVEANMKYKNLKKEEKEAYLEGINDCRAVVSSIL